jgi:hypothetical protein
MESFMQKPEKGNNKIMLGAMLVAALVVIGAVTFLALRPSKQEAEQQLLEGAAREGSPEFAVLTKKIAIQTDDKNTQESPTGMGTISMFIRGHIRNYTGKTLNGLEIKVTVVNQLEKPVKERIITVVPTQRATLENNQSMPVQVNIEGFGKDDDRAMIRWKVTAIKTQD